MPSNSGLDMGLQKHNPLTDIDHLVQAQMQEMEMVRQKVYSLEQTQLAIKQRYDVQTVLVIVPGSLRL